jgi:8-oxo-dGTP diphosphatase
MHTLGATAVIIFDGQVLLTRRRDLPLWVTPGGHLDQGETVQACCLREAKEETGLDVEIERLIGLYILPRVVGGAMGPMTFLFACRVVGGAPHLTDETTAIRYWPLEKLPVNTPQWHRRYLTDALDGNRVALWRTLPTPLWIYLIARPFFRLRRWVNRLRGRPKFTATRWKLGAFVTLFDGDGQVLLVRRRDYPVWNLPGGAVERGETPWGAAVRETREETGLEIEVERLAGVYSKPSRGEIVLNFEGCVVGGHLAPTEEGVESRYFPVNALPETTLPKHVERIHDSAAGHAEAVLKVQDTPSGLTVLGFKQSDKW